jgi:hypothetical protein
MPSSDPYGEEQRGVWLAYRERMNAEGFHGATAERLATAAHEMFTLISGLSDELVGALVGV